MRGASNHLDGWLTWSWLVLLATFAVGCPAQLDQADILRKPPEAGFSVVIPVGQQQAVAIARQAMTEIDLAPLVVEQGPPTTLIARTSMFDGFN